VEDGEDRVSDHIDLLPAVAGQLLADKRDVVHFYLAPVAIAQRHEPFRRAHQVDEEYRRQHPPWREAWARAPARIQRLGRGEVGWKVRDDELKDAFGTGQALEAMRAEVP